MSALLCENFTVIAWKITETEACKDCSISISVVCCLTLFIPPEHSYFFNFKSLYCIHFWSYRDDTHMVRLVRDRRIKLRFFFLNANFSIGIKTIMKIIIYNHKKNFSCIFFFLFFFYSNFLRFSKRNFVLLHFLRLLIPVSPLYLKKWMTWIISPTPPLNYVFFE